MNALAFVLDLTARGVELWLDGDRLRWRGTRAVLTDATVADLRARTPEVKALLRRADADADALRLEAAFTIFNTEAAADIFSIEPVDPWQHDYQTVRCYTCSTERNREIQVCPTCHPPAWLPSGCLARRVCAAAGCCERRSSGRPCRAETSAANETERKRAA